MKELSERLRKLRDCAAGHNPNAFFKWHINDYTDVSVKGQIWERALTLCEIPVVDGDWIPGEFGPCPESVWPKETGKKWSPPEPRHWLNSPHIISGGCHNHPDYASFFKDGLSGRKARLLKYLNAAETDEKRAFYSSLLGIVTGMENYLSRLCDILRAQGRREADDVEGVLLHAPETMRQACQLYWLIFEITTDCPGCMDRVLAPYYEQDLKYGRITEDEAFELVANLLLKIHAVAGSRHAMSGVHHMSIGGLDEKGKCVAGPVTELCLQALQSLHLLRPQTAFRWCPETPRKYLELALETLLNGGTGSPDFSNDNHFIPALMRLGVAREDAVTYSPSGCNELTLAGSSQFHSLYGHFNALMPLLVVLGVENLPEDRYVRPAKSPETYESFFDEYVKALDVILDEVRGRSLERETAEAKNNFQFHYSLFSESCLERGKGYFSGGAKYDGIGWCAQGLVNLGESLAVIREFVYERRELTLEQLSDILKKDWNGHEPLRRRIIAEFPHYGNGNEKVDGEIRKLIELVASRLDSEPTLFGGHFMLGNLGGYENAHVELAKITAATPDGRHAGESFPAGLSARQSLDKSGLTSSLISAARASTLSLPTATIANISMLPSMLKGEENLAKVVSLLETFFKMGGAQLQVTLTDADTLRHAQNNPEEYSALNVRVCGYSAKFIALGKNIQDEIITRTAFG